MDDDKILETLKKALNEGPLEDHEVRAVLNEVIEALEERIAVRDWANS